MTIAIFICPTLQFRKKQTAIETCQVQDDGAKIDLLSGPLPDGMLNRCMKTGTRSPICGRILEHCKEKKLSFREAMGIRLCVFKIGVTTDPLTRYQSYREKGFTSMWVIFSGDSVDLVHMLEAALVSEYHQHVGCRNQKGTGGEGALNRKLCVSPPFYVYVSGARADQARLLMWKTGPMCMLDSSIVQNQFDWLVLEMSQENSMHQLL